MNYHYAHAIDTTDNDTKTNSDYDSTPASQSRSSVTTPLIPRSQSFSLNIARQSLLFPRIRHKSHGDVLHHNLDSLSSTFSIRKYSIEVLPIKSPRGRPETKERIIVPARPHLVKMPFFSTPLTLESTNNAFYAFRERLIEMGFATKAEAALVHTQCESVEDAVTFIIHNLNAIYHRFEHPYDVRHILGPHMETHKLCMCTRCQRPFYQHLLDQNGNKIQIDINEANYNNDSEDYYLTIDEKQEELIASMPSPPDAFHAISMETHTFEPLLQSSRVYTDNVTSLMTDLCLICFENKPMNQFTTSECGHNQYCKACLTEHYKIKTQNGDVLKVKCIDPRCEREIQETEILNFLTDTALKDKFVRFKREKLLMLDENARFCLTADCDGYMIGSRLKPKLVCPECAATLCFNCDKPWHGYFTKCSSAQDANDAKFFQWELNKKENVKKCPKCKIRIEKHEGCNHMTCASCKYQFCWICKGKYSSVHYKQWNIFFGCPGAQYGGRSSICSIHRCPRCCPIWLRRLFLIIAFIILLPLIIAVGTLACCIYVCGLCIYGICRCIRCDC